MNGRKARALRKQAALTAKTMNTVYEDRDHSRQPLKLDSTCHRAVYQQLKKA